MSQVDRSEEETVPAGQGSQDVAPPALTQPVAHASERMPSGQYDPAGQGSHPVGNVDGSAAGKNGG